MVRTSAPVCGAIAALALLGGCAGGDRTNDEYVEAAWAHFRKLCDEKSGEKIYRQLSGIKSALVVKPLPPATEKDSFDQYWYGDPYSASATSQRSINAAGKLVYPSAPIAMNRVGRGLDFVEFVGLEGAVKGGNVIRIYYDAATKDYRTATVAESVSRFGLKWEDISTLGDRQYWVAASRLSIVDLSDNSLVAERVGYFLESGFGSNAGQRRPWLTSKGPRTTCPYSHDWSDRWFVIRVLNPVGE